VEIIRTRASFLALFQRSASQAPRLQPWQARGCPGTSRVRRGWCGNGSHTIALAPSLWAGGSKRSPERESRGHLFLQKQQQQLELRGRKGGETHRHQSDRCLWFYCCRAYRKIWGSFHRNWRMSCLVFFLCHQPYIKLFYSEIIW